MSDDLFGHRRDLDAFLFSEVGVDAKGRTLSVLSALARQDLDPWQEAGCLAVLPKPSAAARLADLIALPTSILPPTDALAIATKLVTLLPVRSDNPQASIIPVPEGVNRWAMLALLSTVVLLAAYFVG